MGPLGQWLIFSPLWHVVVALAASLVGASLIGWWLRQRRIGAGDDGRNGDQEGYVLGATSGLLALLVGFTFSLAIDRFDMRRERVLEEADAIEAAYFKTQLVGEPYRTQISNLLIRYTDNKILLGKAMPGRHRDTLAAINERIKTQLWVATDAAFPTIRHLDFSSSFVDAVTAVSQADAGRKDGRRAHVPEHVYGILFVYQIAAAMVFGYVLTGRGGRAVGAFLLLLFAMSIVLIIEIDRPVTGGINESQQAMIQLQTTLRENPPDLFRHRAPPPQ